MCAVEVGAGAGPVVVTGGSRGIGAAVSRAVAREGRPVVFAYRSRHDEAQRLVKEIEGAGGRALAVAADVGREADVLSLFEACDAAFGPPAALVNNAGVPGGRARLAEVSADQLETVFRTNVFGAFLCSREAVRRMSTSNGGRGGVIVSVSSAAVNTGAPAVWIHYAATKGALEVMSRGLSREVAGEGIRVNVVRPGLIETEVHQGHGEDRLQKLLTQIPLGRMGKDSEVADAVVWLLSPQAAYVTGAVIDVGGGL